MQKVNNPVPAPTKVAVIVVEQHGGLDMLELKDVLLEPPGHGQVLVRLAVAGVNFVDIYRRRGFQKVKLPFVPGLEGAGVVEVIGEGVATVKLGDRVAYAQQPGAYAEATVVPADSLIPLPEDVSFEVGAAFPRQGMTAHYLIHEFRKPSPGDVVLIRAVIGVGVYFPPDQETEEAGRHLNQERRPDAGFRHIASASTRRS